MKAKNPAVVKMPQSGIRLILDEANGLVDVLHLEIGQPDFSTPAHIIEAAERAAREGYTGYTPNAGYWSLREAFAERLSQEQQFEVSPEQTVVSVGAMGALFSALCTVVAPGEDVLLPDPGYPNYYMPIQLLGARAVPYPLILSSTGSLDPNLIQPLLTPNTKAIILNSPSNPTGMVAEPAALNAVIKMAKDHDLYIISDESYDHIVFEGRHVSPLHYDNGGRVISIYSCSKTYAMTGWRVGFSVSHIELAKLITKMQEVFVSCACSISQKAAEAALLGSQDCVRDMKDIYRQRRDLAVKFCSELGLRYLFPHGTFYLMVALPEKTNSMDFALKLLKNHKLAVAPGSTFGSQGESYVRVSLCVDERKIKQGLYKLASAIHS